jgi:hypothetical protein
MRDACRWVSRLGLIAKEPSLAINLMDCDPAWFHAMPGRIIWHRLICKPHRPARHIAMAAKPGTLSATSQAVFARALNVTTEYVSKIERRAKRPTGSTLKLPALVRRKGFDAII